MFDLSNELGVQSFCFRAFAKNEEVIQCVKDVGLSKIEICQKHVDFSNEALFEQAIGLYKKAGVGIVSIGVQTLAGKPEVEEKYFKFVQMAGAKFMSVSFALKAVPAVYRMAEKFADKYDIRLGIHNHGGKHWLGTSEMLQHVFSQTSERIGLCLDTAWALDSREDPIKMVQVFAKRLYGVHFKDFVFDRARKPEDVVVGTGNLNLPALLKGMKEVNFNGYAVLEYEGDVNNPVPAVKHCVEAIRQTAA